MLIAANKNTVAVFIIKVFEVAKSCLNLVILLLITIYV